METKQWRARILHIIMFLFVATIFWTIFSYGRNNQQESQKVDLAEGWTVKFNDTVYEDVDLSEFHLPVANRGDWIVLSTTLPQDMPFRSSLRIHMIFTVTDVYVDGTKIFSYGYDDFSAGTMLGYGTKLISMPQNAAGKNIKITMYVSEDNAFSTITPPTIYEESTALREFLDERFIPLLVSITLITIGLLITVIAFCTFFKSYSMEQLFCIGVFALCIGAWSLCNFNLEFVFTDSLKVKAYLEYMSLYMMMFPLLFYFRQDVESRKNRIESLIYYAFMLVQIQLYVIIMACQFIGKYHFPTFVKIYQIFMLMCGGLIVYLIVMELKEEKKHLVLIIGFCVMLAVAVRDLVLFNLTKYFASFGNEGDFTSYISIAALAFVAALLVDFIFEMRKQMYSNAENQFYMKIAYVDVLTNLYTRRKAEEIFDSIDSKKIDYTLFQFDLNNLKIVNDRYGHEAGDDLIIRFANVLRKTFHTDEVIARMGGDEFVVIKLGNSGFEASEKMRELKENVEADNLVHEPVKISVSVGYAKSNELINAKVREVYKLADHRMYRDKASYYSREGVDRRHARNVETQ